MSCSVCELFNGANNIAQSSVEPTLSRKKKYPESGHRTRDLLYDHEEGESSDSLEVGGSHPSLSLHQGDTDSKQRSTDEDAKGNLKHLDEADSRKLEEKQPLMSQSFPPGSQSRAHPGTPSGPEDHVVPKITEYRAQYVAYPLAPGEARKSASMGIINRRADSADGEIQPVDFSSSKAEEDNEDAVLDAVKRGRIKKTEYKSKFRPFSAYTYVDGNWKKATRLIKDRAADDMDLYSSFSYPLFDGDFIDSEPPADSDRNAWYSEVVERLKKADQYRVRSHAGGVYGLDQLPPELMFGHVRDRTVLSPVSVASSSRTWKDDRPTKDRGRSAIVPVHHRKERKEYPESPDHQLKSREASPKKKHQLEKTTVRPKSAEPTIPVKNEHRSPKRTRPKAPRDLPVHGHGDLSGRKKAYKQATEKSSPLGMKPRAVTRHALGGGEDGKVWLKPDGHTAGKHPDDGEQPTMVNGYSSDTDQKMVNGEADDSVQEGTRMNGEHIPVMKPPLKVPLTTVKSPEEVTGVRSPDPESWTVPLEIGKGLHWMDGKTPDGVQPKGPPILLSKRLKESSLVGKTQKDIVVCDSGIDNTGESVDL